MAIKFLLGIVTAAVGGIYLTSDEGKKAREAILKKKSTFEPIIKDLIAQANLLLEDSDKASSDKVRNSIRKLSSEAKKLLQSVDLEKSIDAIKEAIEVSSKKIREAYNEVPTKSISKKATTKKKTTKTKKG